MGNYEARPAGITVKGSQDWRGQAACRDVDTNLFFPIGETGVGLEEAEKAKSVCRMCPAQPQCLEFAIITNQEHGVWGGTDEKERRKLRKAWVARQRQSKKNPA